jgi:hypothetical protein
MQSGKISYNIIAICKLDTLLTSITYNNVWCFLFYSILLMYIYINLCLHGIFNSVNYYMLNELCSTYKNKYFSYYKIIYKIGNSIPILVSIKYGRSLITCFSNKLENL